MNTAFIKRYPEKEWEVKIKYQFQKLLWSKSEHSDIFTYIFACKSNQAFPIVFVIMPALSVSINYILIHVHKHATYSNYWWICHALMLWGSNKIYFLVIGTNVSETLVIFLMIFLSQIQCSKYFLYVTHLFLIVYILPITNFTYQSAILFQYK